MSFRFFGSLLAVLVPGVMFAQTATVTLTPLSETIDQKTVFNAKACDDAVADGGDIDLYDVKFTFTGTPTADTTYTIKLDGTAITGFEDVSITADETVTVSLTMNEILTIIGETGGCDSANNGIDKKIDLAVDVSNSAGSLGTGATKPEDAIFFDTHIPKPPEGLEIKGGENALNLSWDTNTANTDGELPPEEKQFKIQCKLTSDTTGAFQDCGTATGFTATITTLGTNGEEFVNGESVDVQLLTVDTAGNESIATEIVAGIPQEVLDFGENFNGSEQGGCAVGHGEGQLLWIGFLMGLILLLRRNRDEATI